MEQLKKNPIRFENNLALLLQIEKKTMIDENIDKNDIIFFFFCSHNDPIISLVFKEIQLLASSS